MPTTSETSELPSPRDGGIVDDAYLPAKPLSRPPDRSKGAARQRLAEILTENYNHDPASAAAIARAVVNPAATRIALNSTIDERVPGGTLHMVRVDVLPPAIAPSPINPRAAGERPFPAGTPSDPRLRQYRRPLVAAGSDAGGAPVLTLDVQDQLHLIESTQSAMDVLMSTADKLIDDLPRQGVMRPITVAAMRVRHADGSPDTTFAMSPDGSSRTTIAWTHWGIEGASDIYRLDERRIGQLVSATVALADKDSTLLTEADHARLRLATIPAEVIVGYTPDAGSSTSFAQAIDAWVADIHLDPPRPWGKPADLDTKASAILNSFAAQSEFTQEYIDYLAGMLTPAEAVAAGLRPELDARAVEIIAVIGDDTRMTVLNNGLRRLIGREKKPHRTDRLEPLVELMVRPLRGGSVGPADLGVARTTLQNLRDMAEWNRPGWKPTTFDLASLHSAALDELKAAEDAREEYEDPAGIGSKVAELAFMAVFWLARYGALRRVVRRGEGFDDREPQQLLKEMMRSAYGLNLLKDIIEDGRAERAPRARRVDGAVPTDASGADIPISTTWLKEAFPTSNRPAPGPHGPSYGQAVGAVRAAVELLAGEVRALTQLRNADGRALARSLGIKPAVVDQLRTQLNGVTDELGFLARVWEELHSDDNDEDEDDEE